jgi:hypothetical protein
MENFRMWNHPPQLRGGQPGGGVEDGPENAQITRLRYRQRKKDRFVAARLQPAR